MQYLQQQAEQRDCSSMWTQGSLDSSFHPVCDRSLFLQYLEWREKQYDLRVRVDVFGRDSSEVPTVRGALTYIASADRAKNVNYAGELCFICAPRSTTLTLSEAVTQLNAASRPRLNGTPPSRAAVRAFTAVDCVCACSQFHVYRCRCEQWLQHAHSCSV